MNDLFLRYAPIFYSWVFLLFTLGTFFFSEKIKGAAFKKVTSPKYVIIALIAFRIVYAVVATVTQYDVWLLNPLTKQLVVLPIHQDILISFFGKLIYSFLNKPGGYFLYYSFSHFWLNMILTLIAAGCWYGLLIALKRHKDRFFEDNEPLYGLLLALIAGWPGIVLFIPCTFLFLAILSLVRIIFFKKQLTTIGIPMVIAATIAVALGNIIFIHSAFGVLKI
jgi:hypothetical protein